MLRRKPTFEFLVFARHFGMLTQVVAKRQGSTLLCSARFNNMHMMSVGPSRGPMEEGAEGIVCVRHVDVAELCETAPVFLDGLKLGNGNLDIDDRFCGKAGN